MPTVNGEMLWFAKCFFFLFPQLRKYVLVQRVEEKDDHVIVYLFAVREIYTNRWSTVLETI